VITIVILTTSIIITHVFTYILQMITSSVYTHTHASIHTHTHTHIHTHTYTRKHTHTHIGLQIITNAHAHVNRCEIDFFVYAVNIIISYTYTLTNSI